MLKILNDQIFAKQISEIIREYKSSNNSEEKLTQKDIYNLVFHLKNRFSICEEQSDLGFYYKIEEDRKELYEK